MDLGQYGFQLTKLEFNTHQHIKVFFCEGINFAAREGFIPSNKK